MKAVLLVCTILSCLLLSMMGVTATRDLSTVEKRSAWAIEQRRGEKINPNAKFGAAIALARLALNPDDSEVIDRITHFYDTVLEGQNGEQFTYPGVAWVLGKYWDKFTPRQREHLKAKLKSFTDLLGHGTENHAIMKGVAAYLFAQYWPNEDGWLGGKMNSGELGEQARRNILAVMRSLYDKGFQETLSHNYVPVHLYPYYALYECAKDTEMKAAAEAALCFHVAYMAANHFEGITIPPAQRDYPPTTWNTYTAGGPCHSGHLIHWLYWAEAQNWTPVDLDRGDGNFLVYASCSSWRPPAPIVSLARGETVPYEITSAIAEFGFWGTGRPAMCVRYAYRDKLYAMGSPRLIQYDPDEFYVDFTAFRLIYKSRDKYNYIECYHPYWRSNSREWRGLNSPFEQWAQHKSTAIVLFNIPDTDLWAGRGREDWRAMRDKHYDNLIKEALVRYPKSIDEKVEVDGWIFLREGDVFIAIRPLKGYTIDTDYKPAGEDFKVIRSPFAQTGFIFDVATKEQFATFEAFQRAVKQNRLEVDWDRLSVTYKSVRGEVLTVTWNPLKYDVPRRERVLVQPRFTVNGVEVPIDEDFINARAVIKSNPSCIELVNRVLRVRTPRGELEVDWRGSVPVIRY